MHKVKRRHRLRNKKKAGKTKESKYPNSLEQAKKWNHNFWNTQPIVKLNENTQLNNIINDEQLFDETPILPNGYKWSNFDTLSNDNINNILDFINNNYHDATNNFTPYYSYDFLKWYLLNPNGKYFCAAVEVVQTGAVVGFICAVLKQNKLNKHSMTLAEVNFLCVHHKMRSKNLVPLLIKELGRKIQTNDIKNAIFATSNYITTPLSTVSKYSRSLDINMLLDTGYTKINGNVSKTDMISSLKLPKNPTNKNFVKLQDEHVDEALLCLNNYLSKYNCYEVFDKSMFEHTFLNNRFVTCYVLIEDDKVIDMISYCEKTLRVKSTDKYIKDGYLYYYSSNTETPYRLISDILIVAKNNGVHVFNAYDMMENNNTLFDLQFTKMNNNINYYIYNWTYSEIKPNQLAKIIL